MIVGRRRIAAPLAGMVMLIGAEAAAQSLQGSRASVLEQNRVAQELEYTSARDRAEVRRLVRQGKLVRISPSHSLRLVDVSFPYARPEVRSFLIDLSDEYRSRCGERLTVTSLTRPEKRQPRNASPLSVHPAGMAFDLRIPSGSSCRRWLEGRLLELEGAGVLDATRENRPPHYHVALFREGYFASRTLPGSSSPENYRVRPGDTLWSIAQRHGTTVAILKQLNDLATAHIFAGQTLKLP